MKRKGTAETAGNALQELNDAILAPLKALIAVLLGGKIGENFINDQSTEASKI
jgi:hypothetical protein